MSSKQVSEGAVMSHSANDTGLPAEMSGLFMSSTRFSDVSPLHVGIGKTAFVAIDKSLENRSVIIKTRLCSNEGLSQQLLDHAVSVRKLVHRNIVAVYDAFAICDLPDDVNDSAPSRRVCIVQEILDIDLHNLFDCDHVMSGHRRRFAYQLFAALNYAHSSGVGHFGLKPSNVLICFRDLTLKIADFGIDRLVESYAIATEDSSPTRSIHASANWYCAPEILLKSSDLTVLADIWSAGCIVAEMFSGQPLFQGANEMDQLLKLVDSVHLSDDDWTRVLHVMPNKMLKNHPFKPRNPLRSQLCLGDRQALHLVERSLTFSPNERVTADEAMSNAYFAEYRHSVHSSTPDNWTTFYRNEASRDHTSDGHTAVKAPSSSTPPRSNVRSSVLRQSSREETDEIALQNYLNNHSCTDSPTSNSDDRTPSPSIFDLLDHQKAKSSADREGRRKPVSEASDSDGEKEVAEISDEKLREDLEIGNVSVELLRRLQWHGIDGEIRLPAVISGLNLDVNEVTSTSNVSSDASNESAPTDDVDNLGHGADEIGKITRDFLDFVAKQADFDLVYSKPLTNTGETDGKLHRAVSIEDWNTYSKLAGISAPTVGNLDSNKRNTGCSGDTGDKDKKSDSSLTGVDSSECRGCGGASIRSVSRKIIMEKIESEKVRARRRRSGVGGQSSPSRCFDANLTSEEFDELYRLPTEHLRKDKQQAQGHHERNSRLGIPDRHHNNRHHRHHSHDSFHASGGRHAFTDDDRSYRDVEGACGGIDYYCYDDMAMTHSSGLDFEVDSPPTATPLLRRGDEFRANAVSRNDDWVEFSVTDVQFSRSSTLTAISRDATSSPESPVSTSQAVQIGARPKKSPRKHRPL